MGPPPLQEKVSIKVAQGLQAMAQGLAALHKRRILHLDVSDGTADKRGVGVIVTAAGWSI